MPDKIYKMIVYPFMALGFPLAIAHLIVDGQTLGFMGGLATGMSLFMIAYMYSIKRGEIKVVKK